MQQSKLTIDFLKNYMRIASNSDDLLLDAILAAARQHATTYTGLTAEGLDEYEDITIAILAISADMYDLRQATVSDAKPNPTVAQILNSHSVNLL